MFDNEPQPAPTPLAAVRTALANLVAPSSMEHVGWWERQRRTYAAQVVTKALGSKLEAGFITQAQAAEQGSVVNASLQMFGAYDGAQGVREPTGITFAMLRAMAHHCEPVAAIINTRVQQVQGFCQPPDIVMGRVKKPGFHIRMRIKKQEATPEDVRNMEQLSNFLLECGCTDPPKNERSVNWQPGFESFTAQIIRDRLTYDYVAMRRWKADPRKDKRGKFPVVAFAAEDASKIRKCSRAFVRLDDGRIVTTDWEGLRTNNGAREIEYVKASDSADASSWTDEFTSEEMCTAVGNAVTDETRNGYGYGELERCINAITIWISGREYNSSRFSNDTLPRGLLNIVGNMNQQELTAFKLQWAQMMSGQNKRWFNPIINSSGAQGGAVNWIPIDMSPREMEYNLFMHTVAAWCHCLYSISMAETGYDATSPVRPSLSEPSPEAKIKMSQDNGLEPLMRWYANFLNREVIWKLDPEKKYIFEWVGLEESDAMTDAELWNSLLQGGQATPRMCLAAHDVPIPEGLKENPAMDMLGTWAANMGILMELTQMGQQQEQQKQQMAQGMEQGMDRNQQQNQLAQMQQAQGQAQAMNDANPDGAPPLQPGMPANVPQQATGDDAEGVMQKALYSHWI